MIVCRGNFLFDKEETKKVEGEGCRKLMRSLVVGCVYESQVSYVAVCVYIKIFGIVKCHSHNAFLRLKTQDTGKWNGKIAKYRTFLGFHIMHETRTQQSNAFV